VDDRGRHAAGALVSDAHRYEVRAGAVTSLKHKVDVNTLEHIAAKTLG
jgi:hypothetical protein